MPRISVPPTSLRRSSQARPWMGNRPERVQELDTFWFSGIFRPVVVDDRIVDGVVGIECAIRLGIPWVEVDTDE